MVPAGVAIVILIGMALFGGLTAIVGWAGKVDVVDRRPELYDWEREGDL